jgi:hypothetical protein
MEQMTKITGIGRPLDPRYPTNLAISVLTPVVIVVGALFRLVTGNGLLDSAGWGFGVGVGFFLAWAFARELDPDYDRSAFVGAALFLVGVVVTGLRPPSLLLVFWFLYISRVLNRTTGLPILLTDAVVGLALAGWLAFQGEWMIGILTAIAFVLDGMLAEPNRKMLIFAALAALVGVYFAIGEEALFGDVEIPLATLAALVVISALFVPVVIASKNVQSECDFTGVPITPQRVQTGQLFALFAAVILVILNGQSGVIAVLPVWATMLGISMYRAGALIFPGKTS